MDYVIAGLGLGAVVAIAGFIMRELAVSRPTWAPGWLTDTGLSLMLAAVIIWTLTAAALFSGLDDSTSSRVVAGGSVFAVIGSLVAARAATRDSQPRTSRAATNGVPATSSVMAVGEASTSIIDSAGQPVAASEGVVGLTEELETQPESVPEPVARERKDWEEVWRQTWGSGPLPKAILNNAKVDEGERLLTDGEPESDLPEPVGTPGIAASGEIAPEESQPENDQPEAVDIEPEQAARGTANTQQSEQDAPMPDVEVGPANGQLRPETPAEEGSEAGEQSSPKGAQVGAEPDPARQPG